MVHTFSRGLSEIVLMVEDVLKAAQFHRDVVGLVPCTEADDTWVWFWAGPPGAPSASDYIRARFTRA
jgi:hypothetical protein